MEEVRYSCKARFPLSLRIIHLVTAALIAFVFGMTAAIYFQGLNHKTLLLVQMHQPFGIIIMLMVFVRLVLRFKSDMCGLKGSLKYLAYLTEGLMYLSLLGIPVAGMLMSSYGGHPIHTGIILIQPFTAKNHDLAVLFRTIHNYWAGFLLILIAMHCLAAFYHACILKDKILRRMGFADVEDMLLRLLDKTAHRH